MLQRRIDGTVASGEGVDEDRNGLRDRYHAARQALENKKIEASAKRIVARLPRRPVAIHEFPAVPHKPVTPDVPRTLALGSATGFRLGLLAAFPIALLGRKRVLICV